MRSSEQQPVFVPPMLLTSGPVPEGVGWAFEVKWDGCRTQPRYDCRSVSVRTRNGRECSDDFPELTAIAEVLGDSRVTLDGELVCLRDDGHPDFAQLRRRLTGGARDRRAATFVAFDVLHLDGRSTCRLAYRERRALLDELVDRPVPPVRATPQTRRGPRRSCARGEPSGAPPAAAS
jgi:bifunctional non-homologous end joining protein LigD